MRFPGPTHRGWDVVWRAILGDTEFGLDVLGDVAGVGAGDEALAKRLAEDQLAELCIWLFRNVSLEHSLGFGAVGRDQRLQMWREGIIGELKARGTPEACNGIRRVMAELPALTFLKFHLVGAEEIAQRKSWVPLTPRELLGKIREFEKPADDRPWLEQQWARVQRRPFVYAVLAGLAVLVWFKGVREAVAEPISWISRQVTAFRNGARIPGGTGWVSLGDYDADQQKWVSQLVYESAQGTRMADVPKMGDEIRLTVGREVFILGYASTSLDRRFEAPGSGPVQRDTDYVGTTLPLGTVVQVLDVSRPGNHGLRGPVWVRISVLPQLNQK